MSFLRALGWTIPIEDGGAAFSPSWLDADFRGELGNQIVTRSVRKMDRSFRTPPITAREAETITGLIAGLGHVWDFEDASTFAFSSRGRAPIDFSAMTTSTTIPRFGSRCAVLNGTISWDLSKGAAPLLDRWFVAFWYDDSGAGTNWIHYAFRSDGAMWVDGVRDDTASFTGLSVFNGFVTFVSSGGRFDDLVVLCFVPTDEAVEAWHAWEIDEDRGFSLLPALTVDGDVIEGYSLDAVGTVVDASVLTFSGSAWENAGRQITFRLQERRLRATPGIPALSVYLSFDDAEGDPPRSQVPGSVQVWNKTGGVTMGEEGQVGECLAVDGTGYVSAPNTALLSLSVTSNFCLFCWVIADPSVAEARCVVGKISNSVAGFFWFLRPVAGGLEIVFRMQNSGATLFREISGGVIPIGEWHHIAVSHSANAAYFEIFVDGERVETTTKVLTLSTSTSNARVARIGSLEMTSPAVAVAWLGGIDEFGQASAALTESQIRMIYDAGAAKQRPAFVAS